jgi:hypothetical protein
VIANEQDYGSSVFLSWLVMNDFGVQEYAAWNVEVFSIVSANLPVTIFRFNDLKREGLAALLWLSHYSSPPRHCPIQEPYKNYKTQPPQRSSMKIGNYKVCRNVGKH